VPEKITVSPRSRASGLFRTPPRAEPGTVGPRAGAASDGMRAGNGQSGMSGHGPAETDDLGHGQARRGIRPPGTAPSRCPRSSARARIAALTTPAVAGRLISLVVRRIREDPGCPLEVLLPPAGLCGSCPPPIRRPWPDQRRSPGRRLPWSPPRSVSRNPGRAPPPAAIHRRTRPPPPMAGALWRPNTVLAVVRPLPGWSPG